MLGGGDAAKDFSHRTRLAELCDVATDGGGRDTQDVEQVLHRREGPVLQQIDDQALAIGFLHASLSTI